MTRIEDSDSILEDIQMVNDEILRRESTIINLISWIWYDGKEFLDEPKGRTKFHVKYQEYLIDSLESLLSILYDKLTISKKEEKETNWRWYWNLPEVRNWNWDMGDEGLTNIMDE